MQPTGSQPISTVTFSRARTRAYRELRRRRRLVAALLTGGAALAAVHVWAPPPPPVTAVVAAAHDLPAGMVLDASDLAVVRVDPAQLPAGVVSSVTPLVGQTLAGPMRAGELVTDQRVVGPGLLAGYPSGLEAMPLRIPDADVVRLLHVGDHVDVLAATGRPAADARIVASDTTVVALPEGSDLAQDGGLLVLAVPPDQVPRIAQAAATTQLSLAVLF